MSLGLNTAFYGEVESYRMNVCYTLFFIIESNTGAETQEITHADTFTAHQRKGVQGMRRRRISYIISSRGEVGDAYT